MDTPIFRFDNTGKSLGMVKYESATHEEDLDGTDKLTIVCTSDLNKRDKLVWKDASDEWHEHMVDSTERSRSGGKPKTTATCSNSISELFGIIAGGTKIKRNVRGILDSLLSGTRWHVGDVSDFGTVELEVWHKNVRQCISELCELTGGELVTKVLVEDNGVTWRTVGIVKQRGSSTARRSFTYGRNMTSIRREVSSDEVYTAVRGYGAKKNSSDDNEYADRITVEVFSKLDLSRWGVPTNSGYAHNYMVYTDSGCTDAAFLKKQCQRQLDVVSKPTVVYDFDISVFGDDQWRDIQLGNTVLCIDEGFTPPIRLSERVTHVIRHLKGKTTCKVLIGKRSNPMVEQFKTQEKTTQSSSGNSSRSYSSSPVYTGGGSSYTDGYGGGDGWTHQVNGETQSYGTVNFVTTDNSSTQEYSTTVDPSHWGGVKKSAMAGLSIALNGSWGGA